MKYRKPRSISMFNISYAIFDTDIYNYYVSEI